MKNIDYKEIVAKYPIVKNFLHLYHAHPFDILMLKRGKGRLIEYRNVVTLTRAQFVSLYIKHILKQEEILLQPKKMTCFFIDDAPSLDIILKKAPIGTVIVETSPSKFQLHIPIQGIIIEPSEYSTYQKAVNAIFTSDPIAWNQLRKIPCFYNFKYNPPPEVIVRNDIQLTRPYGDFLDELLKLYIMLRPHKPSFIVPNKVPTEIPRTTAKKSWYDFYTGDRSQTDMKYAVYLLSRGYSIQEVKNILLEESPDIRERKKGHLDDYLRRTLNKAWEIVQRNYKPPQPEEHTPNEKHIPEP